MKSKIGTANFLWVMPVNHVEPVDKVIFCRLIKNARMQGARNPEQ
jgi:hypothetical protein